MRVRCMVECTMIGKRGKVMTDWTDRESIRDHVRHENKIMNKKFKFEEPPKIKNPKHPKRKSND